MKKLLLLLLSILSACATKKKLENKAPFSLGEVYAQPWIIEDQPAEVGYDVFIPIRSLDVAKAVLQNLYHKGQMVALVIELQETGHVAIARLDANDFQKGDIIMHADPKKEVGNQPPILISKPLPFELTETQAVISYLQKDKVRYVMIDGIRINPVVSYPVQFAKNQR
ncbi:hypothetical protein FK220_007245 [Flavobacteriaceae bacterium TP-CH-4]|uniref:Uncharacterized protein n=1 Tax=Pelagihabitans pacificus TaxID=2696054 RepID=A0A967ARP0_9FLAO|nr:hypothetical protein [Pelagihabitans pacificus]NHF59129.1 hypothetical protein [Pelagihabitans pacificus]